MNDDIRTYVIELLETCRERKRKIALLYYELEHPAQTSEAEMISAMALGQGSVGNGCHTEGYISDKTLYIALNYQSKVDKLNANTKEEIVVQLVELEQEQKRLEYYVSLLQKRQCAVIQAIYFDECSLDETAERLGIASRTVRSIKRAALDQLISMYEYVKSVDIP